MLLPVALALLASLASASPPAGPPSVEAGPSDPLPEFRITGDGLRRNVEFWIRIYSEYGTRQGLIHDAKYIDRVYEVVDAGGAGSARRIRASKERWRRTLLSLHAKTADPARAPDLERLTADERRAWEILKDVDEPDKFLNAAHRRRLRFQLGQKDRFIQGIRWSGKYLPRMEEVFRNRGLPVELTRLPFVESSFNVRARSKVGASGIWQFMPSTGRLYLKINDVVDERNDPLLATAAAASLLKENYEALGAWPLAVTAYNHGRKGMLRVVQKSGSADLAEIVTSFRSRTFGFASSNFFACLLAAIEVERRAPELFGTIERDPPPATFEVAVPDALRLPPVAGLLRWKLPEVRELNPAYSDAVFRGTTLLPAGARLRLPIRAELGAAGSEKVFWAGYSEIPKLYKKSYPRSKDVPRRDRRRIRKR